MRLLVFLFCIGPALILKGQTIPVKQFNIDNGLPSNTVRSIFKDSRRIMWIGTASGLCRFDGSSFKIYNSGKGLAAENIFEITEDDNGNLWIGAMGGGISKFDGRKFTNYSEKNGLLSKEVRRVCWSQKFHLLLIGTNKGCSVFDGKNFYSLSVDDIRSFSGEMVVLGFIENENSIDFYSYGNQSVYRYYPATHSFSKTPVRQTDDLSPSTSPLVRFTGDTLWSWGRQGIKIFNHGLKASFDSMGQVFHMTADGDGNTWIAAWSEIPGSEGMPGGLYRFDGKKMHNMCKSTGITDPSVWTVFFDSVFHMIWVGTLHHGIYRIPAPVFEWYEPDHFGLTSMQVNDMLNDRQGNIWLATSRDIIRMDAKGNYYRFPQREMKAASRRGYFKYMKQVSAGLLDPRGSFKKYNKLKSERKYPFPNPYEHTSSNFGKSTIQPPGSQFDPALFASREKVFLDKLSDTSASYYSAIAVDSRNNVYVSGGWGLNRFSGEQPLKAPEPLPLEGNLWVLAFDSHDTLYWSSYWEKGIFHAAVVPEVFYPNKYFSSAVTENAPMNPVRMISRGDEIWCAGRMGGLYLTLKGKNRVFLRSDSTLLGIFNDLCFDGKEKVIAGSNNGEIIIGRREGEEFRILFRLNENTGIVGNSVKWLACDPGKSLYAGTNEGINIIDLEKLYSQGKSQPRFFSKASGYLYLNGRRGIVDRSGDLWVANDKGICRLFHKMAGKNAVHKARLVLTGMEVNNVPVKSNDGMEIDPWFGSPKSEIDLSPSENNITFNFSLLNYLDPDHEAYRFRLIPVLMKWSEFNKDRKAVFNTLRPGKYTFELEGLNFSDRNEKSKLSYTFIIHPPIWQRWWFIVFMFLVVAGAIYLIVRRRIKQIRKEEKQKADILVELNSLEMKALKSQMNPHFIFNAINSIQSFILSNNTDKALFYLSVFSKLVRRTLDNATREFITLAEEMEYLAFYIQLEEMRFEEHLEFNIQADPEVQKETLLVPPMIVQPFVENAIKHGLMNKTGKGKLSLSVTRRDESHVVFIVEDNGVGRKRAEEIKKSRTNSHVSMGMEMTLARIELLNKGKRDRDYFVKITDLYDQDGVACGTRVEITMLLVVE